MRENTELLERLDHYVDNIQRGVHVSGTQMRTLLLALHATIEAVREDAARWRHARKLLTIDDIEGAQGAYDSFGRLISEDECVRADAAIDAARGASNG